MSARTWGFKSPLAHPTDPTDRPSGEQGRHGAGQTSIVPDPLGLVRRPAGVVTGAVTGLATGAAVLARAGLLRPMRPDVLPRALLAFLRDGVSPAAAYAYGAARYPQEPALSDEGGTLTFDEVPARIAGYGGLLFEHGVRAGSRVGLLARNHNGFVISAAALSHVGADVILMNTASSSEELATVADTQELDAVVHDESLAASLARLPAAVERVPVWRPGTAGTTRQPRPPALSRRRTCFVLLTSGTTGAPKGAARRAPRSLEPLVGILSRIPYRVRDTTMIASPLFHAWGFGNLGLALTLSSTLVLRERFDAEETLAALARHRVRVLVAVPVMLQRIVELPAAVRRRYDTSSLEVVASSGSALPGELALEFMDRFGDVLYNLYGSTEAAWASVATPEELRREPATAGRPPYGTRVRIVDDGGRELGPGEIGHILVGNSMASPIEDGERTAPGGFVATGDLGHIGSDGLLFVDGRADEMIVSGGENVYPAEVEGHLAAHPAVKEVAVVGVDDPDFGQRLRAVVVLRDGAAASEDDLKRYLRTRIAGFKVPREIVFLAQLPRNVTGKTLHRTLRDEAP